METKRTCDGCTECCKGWLHGSAHGHDFYPGKPCFFLSNKCTIYDDRPKEPCRSYKCHWLETDDLPMWMRPDLSKVVVTKRHIQNIEYFELLECGEKMDSAVLSWFIQWAFNNRKNLLYQIDGAMNRIGNKDFLDIGKK